MCNGGWNRSTQGKHHLTQSHWQLSHGLDLNQGSGETEHSVAMLWTARLLGTAPDDSSNTLFCTSILQFIQELCADGHVQMTDYQPKSVTAHPSDGPVDFISSVSIP